MRSSQFPLKHNVSKWFLQSLYDSKKWIASDALILSEKKEKKNQVTMTTANTERRRRKIPKTAAVAAKGELSAKEFQGDGKQPKKKEEEEKNWM